MKILCLKIQKDVYKRQGEKKLVASSYIKLEITETSQAPDEKPDYGIIDMSADKAADYHKLEGCLLYTSRCV